MKVEHVERTLGLRPVLERINLGRKLKERVDLKACATSERVLDGHAARADVAGAAQLQRRACDGSSSLRGTQGREHAQVPIAQVGAAVRDSAMALEHALGVEQPVGVDQEVGP